MKNLYIVTHPPTGMWEFAVLEHDQPESLVKGYLLQKRSEEFLHDVLESGGVEDIQQLIKEMVVYPIGFADEKEVVFNGQSIIKIEERKGNYGI